MAAQAAGKGTKKMTTLAQLLDVTNEDWHLLADGKWALLEGDYDLKVRAYAKKIKGGGTHLFVHNSVSDWEIDLGTEWEPWIMFAMRYLGFDPHPGWTPGSAEHFWAMAKAMRKFGTEAHFGATQEGIYGHVGADMVFITWDGTRYDLFDQGCHAFAGTPAGVMNAYERLKAEIVAYDKLMEDN